MSNDVKRTLLTPKLRFPEFRDETHCQVKKLNQLLFEAKTRNRTLELGPADVLSVSGEHGCVNQIEHLGRSYAGVSVKDYHVVEHGDVVYTKSPLKKYPFGIIKENKGKRGIVSTLYAVYRPLPNCSAVYLDHFFSGEYNLNSYLQPIVKKGAKNDMKVNNADVLRGEICIPDLPEQQRIADCLTSLDKVIAAQRREVEALRLYKSGLMQQLFPREGTTLPRLRFPEFRDAPRWSAQRMANVLDRVSEPIAVEAGAQYREIGVRSHGKGIFHKEPVSGKTICDKRVFSVVPNAFVVNIVFAWEQAVATTSDAEKGMIASHRFPMYLPKLDACDVEFLMRAFLTPQGKHLLGVASPGGAGRNRTLGQAEFEKIEMMLPPHVSEQQRIARCLGSLDALLNSKAEKLEFLKIHKKGLMQQLFPELEERR